MVAAAAKQMYAAFPRGVCPTIIYLVGVEPYISAIPAYTSGWQQKQNGVENNYASESSTEFKKVNYTKINRSENFKLKFFENF